MTLEGLIECNTFYFRGKVSAYNIESAHREGLFGRKIIKISFSYLMNRITKCIASSGLISVTSVHQHTTNGIADSTNQLGSVFISMQRIIICQSAPLANL